MQPVSVSSPDFRSKTTATGALPWQDSAASRSHLDCPTHGRHPPEGCLRPHTRSPFKNQCAGLTKLVRRIFSKVRPPVRAFVSPPTAFLPRFCSSECKSSELCLRICAMSSSIFSIQRRFAIYEFFFRRFFSKNSADEG